MKPFGKLIPAAIGITLGSGFLLQPLAGAEGNSGSLGTHQMGVFAGQTLYFFSEPVARFSPPTSGIQQQPSTIDKSRVFIAPSVQVPLDGLFVTDANGDWITSDQLNLTPDLARTATVSLKLKLMLPPFEADLSWKKRMISVMCNLPDPPALRFPVANGFVVMGTPSEGEPDPGKIFAPTSGNGFMGFHGMEYKWYLDRYSFELMAVRGLSITVTCNGTDFPPKEFGAENQHFALGSSFTVSLKPGDISTIKAFKRGDFQVLAKHSMSLSEVQVASVINDVSGYTNQVVGQFVSEVNKASTSGASFFVFGGRSTSMSRWVLDEAKKNSTTSTNLTRNVVFRNVSDSRIIEFVDDFLWPSEPSKDAVVTSHLEAAEIASSQGKGLLADAHRAYANSLKTSDSNPPKVDALRAAASLAAGDIPGFLASGIAVEQKNSKGTFEYRKLRSISFSESDVQTLNAMLVQSVDSKIITSIADFPLQKDISDARDLNPEGRITTTELVKIAKSKIGPWLLEPSLMLDLFGSETGK